VRALICHFDALLACQYGVFTFTDEADCLLRLQVADAPHRLRFSGQVVERGEPVLLIHLLNEHIPLVSPAGPDLAWAKIMQRAFLKSLRAVSVYMQKEPRLTDIRAVGGVTVLMFAGNRRSGERFMQGLGFTVMPYASPLGRFGEFWENFYSWVLIWTYNPSGLRYRKLFGQRRAEFWIPAEKFLSRFGRQPASHQFSPLDFR
jgi:YkoP domain